MSHTFCSFDSVRIMEGVVVGMSLNATLRVPFSSGFRTATDDSLARHSLFSSRRGTSSLRTGRGNAVFLVEAKGKRGMMSRQFQRPPPPPLPKIEDDGNPKFVIFIRTAEVCLYTPWFPLSCDRFIEDWCGLG